MAVMTAHGDRNLRCGTCTLVENSRLLFSKASFIIHFSKFSATVMGQVLSSFQRKEQQMNESSRSISNGSFVIILQAWSHLQPFHHKMFARTLCSRLSSSPLPVFLHSDPKQTFLFPPHVRLLPCRAVNFGSVWISCMNPANRVMRFHLDVIGFLISRKCGIYFLVGCIWLEPQLYVFIWLNFSLLSVSVIPEGICLLAKGVTLCTWNKWDRLLCYFGMEL